MVYLCQGMGNNFVTHTRQKPMNEETKTVKTPIVIGEFHGAFAPFTRSAYFTLKYAGLDAKIAHKIARDFGSDIGNALANAKDGDLAAKVSKAKKDGTSDLKLSAKGSTATSPAMRVIRVCQVIDGLYMEALIASRKVELEVFTPELQDTIVQAGKWASEQVWA